MVGDVVAFLLLLFSRNTAKRSNLEIKTATMRKCVRLRGFLTPFFNQCIILSECDLHEVKRTAHLYFNWLQSCCNIVAIITPSLAVLCEDFMLILQNTDSSSPQGWLRNPIMNLPFYFRVWKMFTRSIVVCVRVCLCVLICVRMIVYVSSRRCKWRHEPVCTLSPPSNICGPGTALSSRCDFPPA